MVQLVKDLGLSLQQSGWLLWRGFSPWPRNFYMLWAWPKGKEKRQKEKGNREQRAHIENKECDGRLTPMSIATVDVNGLNISIQR